MSEKLSDVVSLIHCTLCSQDLPSHPIVDDDKAFCCPGCHAVFNILAAKQELDCYEDHPVFQQAVTAGVISNPALLEQLRKKKKSLENESLAKLHLEVGEMWCPACAEVIKLMLLREKGVKSCVVDYTTDLASIEYAPRYLSKGDIIGVIGSLGYQVRFLEDANKPLISKKLYLRLAIAMACWLNIMMFAYPLYVADFHSTPDKQTQLFAWLSFAFALPVMTYCAWPIWRRFFRSLQVGLFGMETLVLIGTGAAFSLSSYQLFAGSHHVYFDSMSAIISLVLLGKIIEAKAKFSAKESILRLSRALPRRGRKRFSDGREAFVPLKEIQPGDIVIVCTGEKIVLDGLIVSGEGACDESLVSGESVLVSKKHGDPVLGGAILKKGSIVVQVTRGAEASTLQRIVHMVEEDLGHKSSYVRAADHIVRYFVPVVLGLALVTFFLPALSTEMAVLRAISVLLISCPCALGIAAPLAESLLMSQLASLGVIVRNRGVLRLLGKETRLVVDKTGTVTEGCYRVLAGMETLTSSERSMLKGLAGRSTHPVACAISEAIEETGHAFDRVIEHVGLGLEGWSQGQRYVLGSEKHLSSFAISIPVSRLDLGSCAALHSEVFFSAPGHPTRAFLLGDELRSDSSSIIHALSSLKPVLLSGDSRSAVEIVAKDCQFSSAYWRYSPQQKREFVESLRSQGEIVCMVGDGINDAPALAASHVGISVLSATDMSIQASDLLLTTDRLAVLPQLRALAVRGRSILKQNLFWAFAYNVIGIGLAMGGLLQPLYAAFAMVLSSLIVVLNALRLRFFSTEDFT